MCIDDHSRLSFAQIHADEKAAVAQYKRLGVTVTRVMADNGLCYTSEKFAKACKDLKLKHIRTQPYTTKPKDQVSAYLAVLLGFPDM